MKDDDFSPDLPWCATIALTIIGTIIIILAIVLFFQTGHHG